MATHHPQARNVAFQASAPHLSTSNDSLPPGGQPPTISPSARQPPETLTQKYNRVAAHSSKTIQSSPKNVSVTAIKELEKKLSRPVQTAELNPLGNVVGNYDPYRDRKIRHTIKAIQTALNKRQDMARQST